MSRLPPATPMASPIANDNPTVTVLLIAFLPHVRPGEAVREHPFVFFARSRLRRHSIPEVLLFELLAAVPAASTSTFYEHAVHWRIAPKPRTVAIPCCFPCRPRNRRISPRRLHALRRNSR